MRKIQTGELGMEEFKNIPDVIFHEQKVMLTKELQKMQDKVDQEEFERFNCMRWVCHLPMWDMVEFLKHRGVSQLNLP